SVIDTNTSANRHLPSVSISHLRRQIIHPLTHGNSFRVSSSDPKLFHAIALVCDLLVVLRITLSSLVTDCEFHDAAHLRKGGYSGEGEHRFRREAERRSGVMVN